MNIEAGGNQEKISAIEKLKSRAMEDIGSYYLGGMPKPGQIRDSLKDAKPNTWNHHGGIILMIDNNERIHALPSTDEYLSTLQNDPSVTQDSGMGIPRLGDPEVWDKNYEAGLERDGFNEWKKVWDDHYGAREKDANTRAVAEAAEAAEPTLEDLESQYKV